MVHDRNNQEGIMMYRLIFGGALIAQAREWKEVRDIQNTFPPYMATQMEIEEVEKVNCMQCGAEGGKDYHNPDWLSNRGKMLISHIVRCDKCYDHVAQEIWREICDCFEGGKD